MDFTILGSAASFAGPGQACSGYLVESGGASLIIDCGNGTIANAAAVTDVTALDAVFVSHAHADHFLDLYALQAALRFSPDGPVGSMPAYLPEALWERMNALLPEKGQAQLAQAFEPHVLAAAEPYLFGGIAVTAFPVEHDGPSFALLVEAEGIRLIYSGDTRDCGGVRSLLSLGCDVLVAECTLPAEFAGRAAHLTAAEAGALATQAGASLLVLTHLWPTADHEAMQAEARETFDGEVMLARELATIEIRPPHAGGDRGTTERDDR